MDDLREKQIYDKAYARGYKEGHQDGVNGRLRLMRATTEEQKEIIKNACSNYFGVLWYDMVRPCRKRELAYARMMMMVMLYKFTRESFVSIGKYFNRDHTTILHARDAINNLIDTDESVRKDYEYLSDCLRKIIIYNEEVIVEAKNLEREERKYPRKKRLGLKGEQDVKTLVFNRPAAIYSNTGHLNLLSRYSEVS